MSQPHKDILLYLVHTNPPVSIDTLSTLSGMSAVTVLNVMEDLKKRKIVYDDKGRRGVYFFNELDLSELLQEQMTGDEAEHVVREVIDFYNRTLESEDEKHLVLARLYQKLQDPRKGLIHIKEAADILTRTNEKDAATAYYDYLLDYFTKNEPMSLNAAIFIESVLKKVSLYRKLERVEEQMSILGRAEKVARRFKKWELLARVKIELSEEYFIAGRWMDASKSIGDFRKLAAHLKDEHMLRIASLAQSELYFYSGRVLETTRCYEEVIGGTEEFGDDEKSLRVASLVGWAYVICGRISRGMGMIDAALAKAQLLNLDTNIVTANLLRIHSFLEIRRIPEAEAILSTIKAPLFRGNVVEHLMEWSILTSRAYVLCVKEDYAGAHECYEKAMDTLPSLGWKPRLTPWILECLELLEAKGYVVKGSNYDSELQRIIGGQDIHVKGYALRYRAVRSMAKGKPSASVLADLKNSERYLKKAGAEIEIARTQIALGNYYLRKGDTKLARSYLGKAWRFFSTIDKNLFPTDLLSVMTQEQRTEFMANRMVTVNESLGTTRDISSFLERVINVAIDLTMARRGAFFVVKDGSPEMVASRNVDASVLSREGLRIIKRIILSANVDEGEVIIHGLKDRKSAFDTVLKKLGYGSLVCIAAKLADHVYGYLCIDNPLGGLSFADHCFPFLRILSSQIAVGLSNINMYNEMKALKERFQDEAQFYRQEMGIANQTEMIVGRSKAIQVVFEHIQQVAPTDSSVLILGETGAGKELVAKAIHNLSRRKDGPFISVNLAALPHELMASELFGHEKGAFTGAHEARKGRFELAHGGTIFLDEIGDLPQAVQVRLLRVLQERSFERLGSSKPIQSDFRILAATNKDLLAEVEKGFFRQDLYYRLNVFPIYVPPLRDRKEDIPHLTDFFVERYARKLGKRVRSVSSEEMKKLIDYHWPGNVRELKHIIERAVILSNGQGIHFSGFEQVSLNQRLSEEIHAPVALSELEKVHIESVLKKTKWRVSGPFGAASILGLKSSTLVYRMRKLGIKKPLVEIEQAVQGNH